MRLSNLLSLMFLLGALGCSDTADELPSEPRRAVSVTLSASAIPFTGEGLSRTALMRDPLYENVISTIFVMQFDNEGIRCYCSDSLRTLRGSETALYDFTTQLVTSADSRVIVLVNFTQAEYDDIFRSVNHFTNFSSYQLDLSAFSELRLADELRYLHMIGEYRGDITEGTQGISVLLGRYMARLTLRLRTLGSPLTDLTIGFDNAPRSLPLYPAEQASLFPELDESQTFDERSEMTEYIGSLADTTFITDNIRYYYLPENLSSAESGMQTHLVVDALRADGTPVAGRVSLTSSGYVNRNTNYEVQLSLGVRD